MHKTYHYILFIVLLRYIAGDEGKCEWLEQITTRTAKISVTGAGFHRQLSLNASIQSFNRFMNCRLSYRLIVPAGAYIDYDVLLDEGSYQIAQVYFDTEAGRERSVDSTVHICSKRVLRKTFVFNENIVFSIHIRYHHATGFDANITLYSPQILIRCDNDEALFNWKQCSNWISQAPCDCHSFETCDWIYSSSTDSNSVTMSISTGDPTIKNFVFLVTVFVVFCGTVVIIFNPFSEKRKRE